METNPNNTGDRMNWLFVILFIFVFIPMTLTSVVAIEDDSYYDNPAQAAHAAQLAEEAALNNEEVQDALEDFQAAQDDFNAIENPTEDDIAALQEIEKAYEDKLAEQTGLAGDDIEAMRDAGMGWGDIAHELNIHPSALGLGNKFGIDKKSNKDIAADTARNAKNGNVKGHGTGLQGKANSNSGKGLGANKSSGKSKGSDVAGAAGLGGKGKGSGNNDGNSGNKGGNTDNNAGKGNKGGNGKGNNGGNGKGGGKK